MERPSKEDEPFTNLYVKCFPSHFKEQDLCELFDGFGPIQAAKIMMDQRGRAFGFVNFEQSKDAKECVRLMHRKDLRTRKEQKEAKKLEAEGKAPPVTLDMDGHPEHLLYVGRAQKKEEREAMFQKQKGAAKGNGKGDGKGERENCGKSATPPTLSSKPMATLPRPTRTTDPPSWSTPLYAPLANGGSYTNGTSQLTGAGYVNGHGGGGWSEGNWQSQAPWSSETYSSTWERPHYTSSWDSWPGTGNYNGTSTSYGGCDVFDGVYSSHITSYQMPGPKERATSEEDLRPLHMETAMFRCSRP
ncbi:unnamed protein product [Durusdinium trenchii]